MKPNPRPRRLGGDPEDWLGDPPGKPLWMRWRTYDRLAERWETTEDLLDEHLVHRAARWMRA